MAAVPSPRAADRYPSTGHLELGRMQRIITLREMDSVLSIIGV